MGGLGKGKAWLIDKKLYAEQTFLFRSFRNGTASENWKPPVRDKLLQTLDHQLTWQLEEHIYWQTKNDCEATCT